ncbi:hypothetical protein M404DRAFT_32355 [Pisolithus tinctorius Marx 270]|uniref:Uncharacterized protein n=1 Tax=Pisolithus tinctorius Marx 270 TaxID=870435 RepID=A0A0C3IKC6_PISTI|nr:hypothetical protein M404DRAFT_32355 [Pisolithus tinctorius Marx 270]
MFICQSRTPYNQDLLPNLTWVMSIELQVGSNDEQAIQGKLAECKRDRAKAQEEAQLEAERQEQAWLKEERVHEEAEAQRLEAMCKAEEVRKAEESQQADALVGQEEGQHDIPRANNEEVEEITGPSRKTGAGEATSEEAGASSITGNQMEYLIKAVERITDNVASLAVAQKEVSRNFYQFAQSYETYVEEHFKFLVLDMPLDQCEESTFLGHDTTDEEDEDDEGLNKELEGLREEEEGQSQSESGDQASASSERSQA